MVIMGEWRQLIVGFSVCTGIVENRINLENDWNDPFRYQ